MHIADLSKGMLGANAIVGGSPPLVIGAALAAKTKQTGKVAVAFTGDGGSNQGTVFEAMNMAVVLALQGARVGGMALQGVRGAVGPTERIGENGVGRLIPRGVLALVTVFLRAEE